MDCQDDRAPRVFEEETKNIKKGLILVNTGEGKGKSTAAFGTALRAMGRGYKVAIVQFIKGNWKTGEGEFFKAHKELCDHFVMGTGFTWDTKNFDEDKRIARKAWEKCKEVLHDEKYQLVIFDEINYVLKYNFLDTKEVVEALKQKPPFKHVILTGGGAPEELIAIADLVTEMKCIKHPYYQGIKAQAGIEY